MGVQLSESFSDIKHNTEQYLKINNNVHDDMADQIAMACINAGIQGVVTGPSRAECFPIDIDLARGRTTLELIIAVEREIVRAYKNCPERLEEVTIMSDEGKTLKNNKVEKYRKQCASGYLSQLLVDTKYHDEIIERMNAEHIAVNHASTSGASNGDKAYTLIDTNMFTKSPRSQIHMTSIVMSIVNGVTEKDKSENIDQEYEDHRSRILAFLQKCYMQVLKLYGANIYTVTQKILDSSIDVEFLDNRQTEAADNPLLEYNVRVPFPWPDGGAGYANVSPTVANHIIMDIIRGADPTVKLIKGADATISEQFVAEHDIKVDTNVKDKSDEDVNVVSVRWFDGYLEEFESTEVRFGSDLLFMRLANGRNRQIPLRNVRWFAMTEESHQS